MTGEQGDHAASPLEDPLEVESVGSGKEAALADALVETAESAGAEGDVEREDACIDRLHQLATSTEDPTVLAAWADALVQSTDVDDRPDEYWEHRSIDTLEEYVDELADLVDTDSTFAAAFARATANLVSADWKERDLERSRERIDRIRALYDGEDAGVAAALADAVVDDGRNHAKARERDEGGTKGQELSALDEAERLYDRHATDGVAAALAAALNVASVTYADQDCMDKRDEALTRIETLYEAHPTPEVAAERIWALGIAAQNDIETGALQRASERVQRTERLHETHETSDTAGSLGRCYVSLADGYFLEVDNLTAGERVLDDLEDLYESFPDAVAEYYSKKLVVAIEGYLDVDRVAEAERKLDRIEWLHDECPDDEDVAEHLHDALRKLFAYYSQENEVESARRLFDHSGFQWTLDSVDESSYDSPDQQFRVQAINEQLVDDTDVEKRLSRSGTPGVALDTAVLSCLLTGGFLGMAALAGSSLDLLSALVLTPPPAIPVRMLLVVAGFALLFVHYKFFEFAPLVPTHVGRAAPALTLTPPFLPDIDGGYSVTNDDIVTFGIRIALVIEAVVAPSWLLVAVLGTGLWVLVDAVSLVGLTILNGHDVLEPSITSQVDSELLEKLDGTPATLEREFLAATETK